MTREHPALAPLSEVETDVADIARWGRALIAMGTSDNHIHPGAAFVIGEALERLGSRVDHRWMAAMAAVRQPEGGR